MAKVQIKSEKLTPFGGIFSIMEQFDSMLSPIIDQTLGQRCSRRCHGDWSMASPPTCQEVIDVTSTRPLSKDFDVKRFGLNTTSRIKAFVFRFVSIPAKRIRTSNANAIIHSSFFIYSIIWGKDSENLRTSQI